MLCAKRFLWVVVGILLAGLAAGCASFRSERAGPKVGAKTFGWLSGGERFRQWKVEAPNLASTIRRSVDAEFHGKGYRLVPYGDADLWVTYHAIVGDGVTGKTLDDVYMRIEGFADAEDRAEAAERTYEKGTLVIDVIGARSRRVIWREAGMAGVHSEEPKEEDAAQIRAAVGAILRRFPAERDF